MRYLETSIYKYLQKKQIAVAKNYITNAIATHTEYPALTSATDALDALGINYTAGTANKNDIQELQYPLLAHSNNNGGELVIINNKTELLQEPFFANWSGTVIMVNNNTFTNNTANKAAYAAEQKQKKLHSFLFVLLGLFLITLFIYNITSIGFAPLLLLLTSIAGLGIATLIYQQEQGIDNSITDTLCKKTEDCNAVVNSKAATLFWGIKWSDIGLVYFASMVLLLITTTYTNTVLNLSLLLYITSILSIPFTLYSVYYQKQIAKKWCTLCLYTLAILWVQAIIGLVFSNAFTNFVFNNQLLINALLIVTVIGLIAALWLIIIKPFLLKNLHLKKQHIVLERFKLNPNSFINNIITTTAITIPVQPNDLQLGNPNAAVQLVVACNPYCGPCVDVHFKLEEMLHYTKEQIGLTIHFMVNHTPNNSKRSNAINAIYNALDANKAMGNATKTEGVLHQWFTINDVDKFNQFYNIADSSTTTSNLQKSDTSTWDNKIEFTPTLLINGYILPKQYTIPDFIKMVLPFINDEDLVNKLKKGAS